MTGYLNGYAVNCAIGETILGRAIWRVEGFARDEGLKIVDVNHAVESDIADLNLHVVQFIRLRI